MSKLPFLFTDNEIIITQSPHGAYQNFKSMDFAPRPLLAPHDGCRTSNTKGFGSGRYFDLYLQDGSYIQCVHGIPTKENKTFNKGEIVGNTVPYYNGSIRADHWHMAIHDINKGWQVILDYVDHSNQLSLSGNFNSQKWKDWSTYNNYFLDIDTMDAFDDFLNWNDEIGANDLTKENVTLHYKESETSKLVNKTEDLNVDQKWFLEQLYKLNTTIPESLRNTEWLDTIMSRYPLYLLRSNAR